MSFETLKTNILQQAEQEAQGALADLRQQAQSEEARIMLRAQEMEEEIIRQAENEGVRRARRLRQEAELSGRAAVLAAKQTELNATKQALADELLALDAKQTHDLLAALLKLVPDTGTIVPGEKHAAALGKLAKKGHTLAKETIPGEGGFVFRASDSESNLTISHLVNQLFQRYRAEIAQELFS